MSVEAGADPSVLSKDKPITVITCCQSYSYLTDCRASLPFGQYHIVLRGNREHLDESHRMKVKQLRVEPVNESDAVNIVVYHHSTHSCRC